MHSRFVQALGLSSLVVVLSSCGGTQEPRGDGPEPSVGGQGGLATSGPCAGSTSFQIGSGLYDITGPAAEIGMMGYGMIDQKTAGIHQRLRSRAFVIVSPCNGKRVAFVSVDLGQAFQAVKQQVIEKLRATYGTLYTDENVIISATHTHSGPGGHSHYALYNLTILGFDQQGFDTIVSGIYNSIVRAHNNLASGTIRVNAGDLLDASINRSPTAYLLNPSTERGQYAYDVDKQMTLLRFTKGTGKEIGEINWFAVHGTSMGNDSHLISGDNKGYASYLFEKQMGTSYTTTADTFVAAFAQSNEGDVTPNIYGGTNGGGANDFESTSLSANKQLNKAVSLYNAATESLVGGVDYRHAFVKMDEVTVAPAFGGGSSRQTCEAAIGISMLAGAEDGPGFGREGFTCADVHDLWSAFTCAVTSTTCQAEKPIALEMGTQTPYPWTPEVLPLQIVTLGNLAIVAAPFELTTMSGRRLRNQVMSRLGPAGVTRVVIAGLANAYAGYVATREEYAAQEYEGASTHFGPWTLGALLQEFDKLAVALRDNVAVSAGPTPRDLRCCQSTVQTGVVFDDKPLFSSFGSVQQDASASYLRGQTARVTFWGAHPKNDLRLQNGYLQVQKYNSTTATWSAVAYDWDWETKFKWERDNCFPTFACSRNTVEWTIPSSAATGTYRIRHDGSWKSVGGVITPYTGTSRSFTVN